MNRGDAGSGNYPQKNGHTPLISLKTNGRAPQPVVSGDIRKLPRPKGKMPGHQTRVAILDDDQSVRTAISRLLKTSEMSVDLFATSVELLNSLERGTPDCLVLDLQMPGMNGIDVMNYLSHTGSRVPTIVITAHDGPGSRESCVAAGATAYLRKPLDADELLKAIADAIGPVPVAS